MPARAGRREQIMNHMDTPYVLDIHTHTLMSGHAYGTIREMAKAAAEAGLVVLGISEHGPGTPGTCDPLYFLNLNVVPKQLYGVRLLHGCEINVRNDGKLWLEQRYLDRLDYGIVGIHGICYENAGKKKNTQNLILCMQNEKIRFVSHPDDGNMPLDYELLVAAAKEYHVALEVNNSSLLRADRLDCIQNYQTMLTFCERLRVPVVVSSDAHDPDSVGRFDKARRLLRQMDFDEELILNTGAEKLLAHLAPVQAL